MPPVPRLAPSRGGRPTSWRIGTALVLLIGAGLLIISENSSGGTDLRPGRYSDLASLVSNESRQVKAQQQQVAELSAEVERLTESVQDERSEQIRRQARAVSDDAGLSRRPARG